MFLHVGSIISVELIIGRSITVNECGKFSVGNVLRRALTALNLRALAEPERDRAKPR